MNTDKWIIKIIDDSDEGIELFAFDYSNEIPVPNVGDVIWVSGNYEGNGYEVIRKDIQYDENEITITVKL